MHSSEKFHPGPGDIGESVFDAAYLLFDLIAAVIFFLHASGSRVILLYGFLTLLLGGGDAFHLVPRIDMHLRGRRENTDFRLGLGTMVSSVTMTIFYILLSYIWKELFGDPGILLVIIWITALFRIIVCCLPQNNWFNPEGNMKMSLLRNLPFAVTGLCVILLFAKSGSAYGLGYMVPAILICFAFYLPVTLLAKKKPAVGMLMVPKTLAYVWMLCMGLRLISIL